MMYLTFLMITALLLNLSSYCSIDSWISLHIIQIYVYIIRQCYKRRSCLNFKRTTAYYRFKSWLYCHANNHCRCPPPSTQTFLLTPKCIDDPKMAREPVLQSQHPKVEYHGTSNPSTNYVTPVPQQAEVAATNAFAIVQRCYLRVLHLLYRQNQDIHSLALRIQR